jgi:hypothetical protein
MHSCVHSQTSNLLVVRRIVQTLSTTPIHQAHSKPTGSVTTLSPFILNNSHSRNADTIPFKLTGYLISSIPTTSPRGIRSRRNQNLKRGPQFSLPKTFIMSCQSPTSSPIPQRHTMTRPTHTHIPSARLKRNINIHPPWIPLQIYTRQQTISPLWMVSTIRHMTHRFHLQIITGNGGDDKANRNLLRVVTAINLNGDDGSRELWQSQSGQMAHRTVVTALNPKRRNGTGDSVECSIWRVV